MLAARQAHMPRDSYGKFARAQQFIRKINASKEAVWLDVSDDVATGLTVGGADCLMTLNELTNEAYTLTVTEFAIGLNHSIRDAVDWSVNSQMNEGMGGMHLGFGDGFTGEHFDVICDHIAEWSGLAEDSWHAM
jgi:hypothetical protein